MGPAKKFYSLNPGESLEELRRQRGISLCELMDELDKIENQTERSTPCKVLTFENLSEDDKLAQEMLKKLRGALNKLAPDNFYTQLMEMQCTLPVHNLHLMRLFVRQLIQKASKDTFYSLLYAYACKALSSIELLELPEDDDSIDTFGALVLDECYKYFCYNRSSLNWFLNRDPNREESINLDRKEFLKRKTLVGLMRFIGGLFKADLLTVKETFEYIKKLENEVNEKSIEALCCLLSNYGKDLECAALETEFAGDWCATWERISKLSQKESNLPLRQMFMLMDLLDLMNNGWVPKETFQLRCPMSHIEILMDYQEKEKTNPKKSKAKTPKRKNSKNSIVQPSESVDVSDSIIADDPTVITTEQEIIRLLKSDGDVYNMISNWEIKNFEGRKTWFVYSLMRAILRVSIDGNTLNQSKFTEHMELLKKYISSRQAEVACMYAVQYLVVVEMSNPKGLLENITLMLHKTGAVTYIGLLDWRENWSKHPLLEVRGRSAAHIALASLFMKLFWESTRPNYKSIVKELNSFDLEHFVSSSKLPPEIAKQISLEGSQPTQLNMKKLRTEIQEGKEEVNIQDSMMPEIVLSEETKKSMLLTIVEKINRPEALNEESEISRTEKKNLKRKKIKKARALTKNTVSPQEVTASGISRGGRNAEEPRFPSENMPGAFVHIPKEAGGDKDAYVSRALDAGGSRVVIIPNGYPSIQLSREQVGEVKSRVLYMLDKLEEDGGIHPKFDGCNYHLGGYLILCLNDATKDWLISIIRNHTISGGITLQAGSVDEYKKLQRVKVYFPSEKISDDQIMRRLRMQNANVRDIDKWRFSLIKRDDEKILGILQIPETSIKYLEVYKLRVAYGVQQIRLKVLGKKNPSLPSAEEMVKAVEKGSNSELEEEQEIAISVDAESIIAQDVGGIKMEEERDKTALLKKQLSKTTE